MSSLNARPAAINDAADIHALLLKHAVDIPLAVETLDQEEALYAATRKILAFAQSWVALDGEAIVGFVLVESAEVGRHWGENELLNLRYAAGQGLDALIGKVLERKVPVTANVRDANRSGLVALLERHGFREAETRVGERRLRHDP
jgi:ribosomal protein S18 acetylase RimI-like enzyme